ncbi:MAG: hypothetical protein IT422_02745 [Pirellulaceae bacterium]|nr:hypothetical protein [Pirellulaceae bacterium]
MASLTRIIVNLSLIVAITIQPPMVFAFKKDCAAKCVSQLACQGCGGCQVDTVGDRCGCCGGHAAENTAVEVSAAESASCCEQHSSHKQQPSSLVDNDDLLAKAEIIKGPLASESASCCTAESQGITPSSRTVESGCHCLHSPETPCVPEPRSPANEVRDLVSLGFAPVVIAEPHEQRPGDGSFGDRLASANFHFAQIELCVWRL